MCTQELVSKFTFLKQCSVKKVLVPNTICVLFLIHQNIAYPRHANSVHSTVVAFCD